MPPSRSLWAASGSESTTTRRSSEPFAMAMGRLPASASMLRPSSGGNATARAPPRTELRDVLSLARAGQLRPVVSGGEGWIVQLLGGEDGQYVAAEDRDAAAQHGQSAIIEVSCEDRGIAGASRDRLG